jgi:hypothetical protein
MINYELVREVLNFWSEHENGKPVEYNLVAEAPLSADVR